MGRPMSAIAPEWWDYTTLERDLVRDASRLSAKDVLSLARPGFEIRTYETLESFYLAEALEYIEAWRKSTEDRPAGICGPIGPTEQLPLVARMVNELELELAHAHFWAMDEWVEDGKDVSTEHELSFERTDRELCFNKIRRKLRMPEENLHFPKAHNLREYAATFDSARCLVMQGGQGDTKHWAFNDPVRRKGKHRESPPSHEEYLALGTRVVELHPLTVFQNARSSAGGRVADVPRKALTVGPVETWKSERVSIWHPGCHDNPFGMRLTTLMISKKIPDSAVPMSLLALHPNVRFHFYLGGIGTCEANLY
ncbi:MAG: glucosamine-6-phosphate isomerase [Planctomycetota bacterium]